MCDLMTLAAFYGSKWWYITMGGALVVLIIILKLVRGRGTG